MATITFFPDLSFGKIEVLDSDGCFAGAVPSWLIDQPDVVAALAVLAQAGGTKNLARAGDNDGAVVDTVACRVAFQPVSG